MCRFVGYLEEQAVITYTDILASLDQGKLPMWRSGQPQTIIETLDYFPFKSQKWT